jgi:1-acyl-sn-glycerol-3-phosphate acyltransferase/nucleoside-diphosphate-sugar epimerase
VARVIVIDDRDAVAELIISTLRASPFVELCIRSPQKEDGFGGHLSGDLATLIKEHDIDTVVYSPPQGRRNQPDVDLEDAESVFQQCASSSIKKFLLSSSAMIYGANPHNKGFLPESVAISRSHKHPIARDWIDLETLASAYLGKLSNDSTELNVLRPAVMLVPGGEDYFSRLLSGRAAVTLGGHDPSIQLLSPYDLAFAVRCVIENGRGQIYNVAPDGVIPLRAALRLSEVRRLAFWRPVQRMIRRPLSRLGLSYSIEQLEYIRYSWTVSNRKLKCDLGWQPSRSSVEALRDFRIAKSGHLKSHQVPTLEFDDYGLDKRYIAAFGRSLFRFLHDYYWRIEVKDLDYVPRKGRAVLVGVHRGFMPWDAVMALHLIAKDVGRYVRFLIHPGLIKFPFLFNFHTKMGGMIACQENADHVLAQDEMLAIYPEGIRGAFSLYRDGYRLGKFGRGEYVKIALRNRAPIVPFVNVGSAEAFPILKRIDWGWWKRHTDWPFFPLTPTWPLLPVPLPTKWHTRFLEPIHIEDRYPPEAADDPEIVHAISNEVRCRIEEAIAGILSRRKSIFYGSVFEHRDGSERKLGEALILRKENPFRREA